MVKNILQAKYGSPESPLRIGDVEIPCFVLEDGTRVLTQFGFYEAIGRSGKPAKGWGSDFEKTAPFLSLKNLEEYVSKELIEECRPIKFRIGKGTKAWGYRAEVLPRVCDVYIAADDEGALLKSQEKFAVACRAIKNALSRVGIIALVDEATGYQKYRPKDDLQKILAAYIREEFLPWTKKFPDEFYRLLFQLRGWQYDPYSVKRPKLVGLLTEDIVYKRLPYGVCEELKKRNPKNESGNRLKRHHQLLTEEIGNPHLEKHLVSVITIMRLSNSWRRFKGNLNRLHPITNGQMTIMLDDSDLEDAEFVDL